MEEKGMKSPYKVVHIHENQHPFEVECSAINEALQVAQTQLETHSRRDDRAGSLRGEGLVKYYDGGTCVGQVEVLRLADGQYMRIGG